MFQKVSRMEKSLRITDGGYQVIPLKFFLCQRAEKNCGVTLQCFRKNLVWEKISGEEVKGITFSRRIFFCVTVPKKSVFRNNSGIENFHA